METIFMNTENRKTNQPYKFVLKSERLDLRSSNNDAAIQNLTIYYMWKNIRKHYKKNKFKIIAPTWNYEFELPDDSYSASDIQDYNEYIIKKHEILITIPPIHVYLNRINNRLVFKIKDGYKLELQTPETMKLFRRRKKLIDKTNNREKVPNLEVVEVVLVQCNLVDNQHQQNSEGLYTFMPNKSYAYLLNVEPSNLMFLKTYNTDFDEIIVTLADQNGRPLEMEDKVNLTLLINK